MSYHSRTILTPGSLRKRKEREPFYPLKPFVSAHPKDKPIRKVEDSIHSSNQLLAGFMAYEYLTEGTLLGQKYDPARWEAVPLAGGGWMESKRGKPVMEPARGKKELKLKSYDEVASILKTEGAHIPGIVNPTQLARWIQM